MADRCIPGLANHMNNAVKAGATKDEIIESESIGVEFGGGPTIVIVSNYLLFFLNEIQEKED